MCKRLTRGGINVQVNNTANISINSRISQAQTSIASSGNGEIKIPKQTNQNEEQRYAEDKKFSEKEVIDLIEKANKDIITYDRRLEFSIHEKTKQIMVKIIDVRTDEIIRELPPEKILDMVGAMWEFAGIIVDRKI